MCIIGPRQNVVKQYFLEPSPIDSDPIWPNLKGYTHFAIPDIFNVIEEGEGVEFSLGIQTITQTEKPNLAFAAITPRPRFYARVRRSCGWGMGCLSGPASLCKGGGGG